MPKNDPTKGKKSWFGFWMAVYLLGIYSVGMPLSEAADYPSKAVKIICAWPAGGGTDTLTRMYATRLAKHWGVPVSVVQKVGGAGIPGTLEALQSEPDGYTVFAETSGTSSVLDAWIKKVPFGINDRTYIANATEFPYFVLVRADTGWKTLADFEGVVNQNPSSVRLAWLGGTAVQDVVWHKILAFLSKKIGAGKVKQMKMITYPGTAQIVPALAGGHVDIAVQPIATSLPLIEAGKARLIAVADTKRSPNVPDLPTTEEQGWPNMKYNLWLGFCGPKGLPPHVVQAWEKAIQAVIKEDPSLKADLEKFGAVPAYMNNVDFKNFVLNDAKELKALPIFTR